MSVTLETQIFISQELIKEYKIGDKYITLTEDDILLVANYNEKKYFLVKINKVYFDIEFYLWFEFESLKKQYYNAKFSGNKLESIIVDTNANIKCHDFDWFFNFSFDFGDPLLEKNDNEEYINFSSNYDKVFEAISTIKKDTMIRDFEEDGTNKKVKLNLNFGDLDL